MASNPELFTTREAADLLRVSVPYLELCRSRGDGPPFVRIGAKLIRYRYDTLTDWLVERERRTEEVP